tara:strand:- start:1005 stop:1709 length:705 start_codon:yes stop_codon:yes gene_type:complete
MFSQTKHFIKVSAKSIFIIITVIFFRILNFIKFKKLYKLRYNRVHIICPGPTCLDFKKNKFKKDEAFLFINHGILVSNHVSKNKFFISADGTRVSEILKSHKSLYKDIFSIITPEHYRHLNLDMIMKTDLVFPSFNLRLSTKNGIVAKNHGPKNFNYLNTNHKPSGFGSMICALQLAVLFKPKKIIFHGCDIGEVNGIRYFDESVPVRSFEAFNLTKEHYQIVRKKILKMGISI